MRDRTGLTPILTFLRRPGECDRLFTTFRFSLEKKWGNALLNMFINFPWEKLGESVCEALAMRDRTGLTPIPTSLRRPGECDDLIITFKISLQKNCGTAAKHSPWAFLPFQFNYILENTWKNTKEPKPCYTSYVIDLLSKRVKSLAPHIINSQHI